MPAQTPRNERPDLAITVLACCSLAMAGLLALTGDWPRGSADNGAGMAFVLLLVGVLGSGVSVLRWLFS